MSRFLSNCLIQIVVPDAFKELSAVFLTRTCFEIKPKLVSMYKLTFILKRSTATSLKISKNAECPQIARCSEYFDEILVSFSSCMLMELHVLEQAVKNQKSALDFQTADAIWSLCPINV